MSALFRQIRGVIVFAGFTINTLFWIVPLFLLAVVKLLLPIPSLRRYLTRLLMAVGENWISVNTAWLHAAASIDWQIEGADNLRRDGWYLVISNHQTWVDILVLQSLLNRRIPFLKFFIKQQLIWFPVLGLAFWAMDMPFMKRHSKAYLQQHPEQKGKDLEATRRSCEKFNDTPTSVINFIEGTRFSEEKRIKRDSPFRYLLPPRSGGIAVALSAMGKMFDSILDVTIHYPGGVPTFWDVMCGRYPEARIEIVARPVDEWLIAGDYVNDREFRRDFHRWLTTMWTEKDARLGVLHTEAATG